MENTISLTPVLSFLEDLALHNNKPWFDSHRGAYEKARVSFEQFVAFIIDEFRAADDLRDLSPKDCISRIYRDLRFSKDKSPYKTNMWATIAPGGKKTSRMGYHVAIQPHGRSMIAGGLWEPDAEKLAKFRMAIDRDASEFKQITTAKPFVDNFGSIKGDMLKSVPKGYDRSNPEIEILKLKQIVVVHNYTDNQVVADDFPALVISGCQAMRPFLDYLNQIL